MRPEHHQSPSLREGDPAATTGRQPGEPLGEPGGKAPVR